MVESVAHDTASAINAYEYNAFADDYHHDSQPHSSNGGSSSPVAPAYSPITPKVQPVLPAYDAPGFRTAEHRRDFTFTPQVAEERKRHDPDQRQEQARGQQAPPLIDSTSARTPPKASGILPAEYIPQPPNLPFSSDEAGDAIALRAAISTLQFQKRKAREDIKTLATIKQLALDDPKTFAGELATGRLNEQKPTLGDLRSILDNMEEGDDDDEVVLGASREEDGHSSRAASLPAEIPDSQPSQPASQKVKAEPEIPARNHFPRIPGPQNIVRMPPINWTKYGIAGEPLEQLHDQQRRWPGTLGPDNSRGREHTIAAPFSPWLDSLDNQQAQDTGGMRKDSGPAPSATGTISEHVMETRSRN